MLCTGVLKSAPLGSTPEKATSAARTPATGRMDISVATIADGSLAVWTRNAVVDVQDEELDIHGPHWISDIAQSGGDKTTTTITLHKPEHQVYGDLVLPERVSGKKGWKKK